MRVPVWLRPILFLATLLFIWEIAVRTHPGLILPGPIAVFAGLLELLHHGLLLKYVVASLFRVTWGFVLASITAIPLGLALGWYRRGEMAFNPLSQIFRPTSGSVWATCHRSFSFL
jgi:NitT/TauT family transport system permease protein